MKTLRILAILSLLAVVVLAGLNGTAWAGKLNASDPAPAAADSADLPRAEGTGRTTRTTTDPIQKPIVVGSVALVQPQAGCQLYVTLLEDKEDFPIDFPAEETYPGELIEGAVIQLTCVGNRFCGATVCYNVGPDAKERAYYWDGTTWIQSTIEIKDGLACVYVPEDAPNPTFTALFIPK
ncbi:MAG: hypothetical protein ACOY0R_03290 [Chloroflexota bacterium]